MKQGWAGKCGAELESVVVGRARKSGTGLCWEVWTRAGIGSVQQGRAVKCGAGLGWAGKWSRAGLGSVDQGWNRKCGAGQGWEVWTRAGLGQGRAGQGWAGQGRVKVEFFVSVPK